jgi:hypothetical protein
MLPAAEPRFCAVFFALFLVQLSRARAFVPERGCSSSRPMAVNVGAESRNPALPQDRCGWLVRDVHLPSLITKHFVGSFGKVDAIFTNFCLANPDSAFGPRATFWSNPFLFLAGRGWVAITLGAEIASPPTIS